ncbi:MAG TPA: 1-deoxy-D-xylulose-5-phosphate reductoisomerase [Anaerohalosphaeraceae bacterium]|nr:1-deoxy-D-xylulose-5-phosphate reductoisomerase [Phycisphaerae bacterium]HOK95975.1 1-deoxy-D-xylulose-5-phosphate reductoisomerase [Anaerohalosphaeraceae bacterium]HOL30486.1 1-deoxy-D-xylulose-5-phosphate reductoisomerase [Anaerohalosphaeraceae bacterium]HOM75777.1 1-deoxy-D-xylulose-5-phosphate reductoisomerase [Anaerohalosphaeraceae bacterium]HPC63932.1 1-deoxy-D-xylulose-5-phosphate reductoisomerase [Anaerohalosphaeraceae bacterium]
MSKKVAILGSTGSIGRNALRVLEALQPDYEVIGLSAHNNIRLLAEQASKFNPRYIAITDNPGQLALKQIFSGFQGQILTGPESLVELASLDEADIVLCAVVGAAGLPAALAAARLGKTLAIANKEPLVIAGELLTEAARQSGAVLLPIDSEHSAIFQAMQAGQPDEIRRIILTASGGPFRQTPLEQIKNATIQQALAHPTWSMGPKITIDSATMMNKALEVIEAVWLFGVPVEKIEVLVHPESVVHSMVEFIDGSIIAQLGTPDMKVPIQYALTWPKRMRGIGDRLQLSSLGQLHFETPNLERFRALELGFEVARTAGSAPVVFNAANEAAVAAFLDGRIHFGQIVELIEDCLLSHSVQRHLTLDELLSIDGWARRFVAEALVRQTAAG